MVKKALKRRNMDIADTVSAGDHVIGTSDTSPSASAIADQHLETSALDDLSMPLEESKQRTPSRTRNNKVHPKIAAAGKRILSSDHATHTRTDSDGQLGKPVTPNSRAFTAITRQTSFGSATDRSGRFPHTKKHTADTSEQPEGDTQHARNSSGDLGSDRFASPCRRAGEWVEINGSGRLSGSLGSEYSQDDHMGHDVHRPDKAINRLAASRTLDDYVLASAMFRKSDGSRVWRACGSEHGSTSAENSRSFQPLQILVTGSETVDITGFTSDLLKCDRLRSNGTYGGQSSAEVETCEASNDSPSLEQGDVQSTQRAGGDIVMLEEPGLHPHELENFLQSRLTRVAEPATMSDASLRDLLLGRGSPMIDVVLYMIHSDAIETTDWPALSRASALTNLVIVTSMSNLSSEQDSIEARDRVAIACREANVDMTGPLHIDRQLDFAHGHIYGLMESEVHVYTASEHSERPRVSGLTANSHEGDSETRPRDGLHYIAARYLTSSPSHESLREKAVDKLLAFRSSDNVKRKDCARTQYSSAPDIDTDRSIANRFQGDWVQGHDPWRRMAYLEYIPALALGVLGIIGGMTMFGSKVFLSRR